MKKLPIPEFNDKDWFKICKFIDFPSDDHSCWLWTGGITKKGYGKVTLSDGKSYLVHRVICAWNYGDRPDFEAGHALHEICGNTNCCAYHHLSWQTSVYNQRQKQIDGTHLNVPKGEKHSKAKLTDSQIDEIKEKYATGKYTQIELGKEYGVKRSSIGYHVNGKVRNNS